MRPACLLLFTSLLLSACAGEEFQDLRDFVKDTGAGMRGKVDPPPEIKPYEPFVYDNATGLAGSIQATQARSEKWRSPRPQSAGYETTPRSTGRIAIRKFEDGRFPLSRLKLVMLSFAHRMASSTESKQVTT